MDPEMEARAVAKSAIRLTLTDTRAEESAMKEQLMQEGIRCVAMDFGGDYLSSIHKMMEKIVSLAKRDDVIAPVHREEGAVAGAARDALYQVASKATGLSVGGKIAVARLGEHVAVAAFFGVGLGHLNEVCIGMSHRSL